MQNEKINASIRYPQVRVIDENGEQVGIMSSRDALEKAKKAGLDLVEISGKASPPVVKILDYGKHRYEQTKKEKEVAKKQRENRIETKEIWLRPVTDQHDIDIKLNKAKKFLEKGNRVKFGVKFRGREQASMESFKETLEKIVDNLEAEVLQPISNQGRNLVTVLGPK